VDKRLFPLLLYAYICVAVYLLSLNRNFTLPEYLSFNTDLVTVYSNIALIVVITSLIVVITGIFIVIGLCGILSIMAIADAVSKYQIVDFRYFTRCFIYRMAFLLWPILISFAII